MFVIVNIQQMFHTLFIVMFKNYLHNKFHIPISGG